MSRSFICFSKVEIFPINMKGNAGSLVTLVIWIGTQLVSYTFNFLMSWILQHMVISGLPLAVFSILNHDPVFSEGLKQLTLGDILALLYTSVFGSAISYGVFFYSATKG